MDQLEYVDKALENKQWRAEDLIWVTYIRTKKIYRNKHSALCHRVVNYSPWQLATDCVEVMNGQNSPYEIVKGFINECSLTVEPPSTEDHTDNICLAPDITACNLTGKWNIYDQSMETACISFQRIYIQRQVSHTVLYRNITFFIV